MEEPNRVVELISPPKDISVQFLTMEIHEFLDFLRTQRQEPSLSITIDWMGVDRARRLEGFLEDFDALRNGQKRSAAIRATQQEHDQGRKVFASRVKWIKKE